MSYPQNIHPWTIDWFETLPQSYQSLDAVQKNPPLTAWDGLNEDPYDLTEAGGWSKAWELTELSTIVHDFNSTPGIKVHYQIWAEPGEVSGGALDITVKELTENGPDGDILLNGETSGIADAPVLLEGWFYPTRTGKFTVAVTTNLKGLVEGAPVPDSKPVIKAVNISTRQVTYEELSGSYIPETFHPLLRFMDGVGQIGGEYRETSDNLWDGVYTNPDTCPDNALRWLAQMMGIHRNVYGVLSNEALRDLLKRTAAHGLAAIGSRSSLQEVFKSFLTGDQTCNVVPHPTEPHTIRVRVVLDEVPGGDLAALGEKLRASGTVPAGHVIQVVEGIPTWDQWESAAGTTWNDYEANASTWSESDTLGLSFD
ncbi:hypothetical protein [Glutamicibacter ardleyensis]|uniref:hypothetical protein n=1 Tax=Glutamicibacter ardleyensis TaxID=225894 RepID=UPI003FD11899